MRNIKFLPIICICVICACSKQDPILPGVRAPVFKNNETLVLGLDITDTNLIEIKNETADCPYVQTSDNIIKNGDKKIFSGFAVTNFIDIKKQPVCKDNFIYAGLSTGELVKINSKTNAVAWIADIYASSAMTGGSDIMDITAPIVFDGANLFVGGLGDSFCKINIASGAKIWCQKIPVGVPFLITEKFAFVIGIDGYLYAINTNSGDIYWRVIVKEQTKPELINITDKKTKIIAQGIKIADGKFKILDGSKI